MSGTSSSDFKENKNNYGHFISKYVLSNLPSQAVKSISDSEVTNPSCSSQDDRDINSQVTVDEIVKKITETVKKYEKTDSTRKFSKSSLKRSLDSKEFVSFSQIQSQTNMDDDSVFNNSLHLEENNGNSWKIDSQWSCDTQLATLVDNADAILNLFDSNEMSECHTLQSDKSAGSSQTTIQNDVFRMPLPVCKNPINKTKENFLVSKSPSFELSDSKSLLLSQSCEFKTANQRNITISKGALEKVSRIFDNIDGDEPSSVNSSMLNQSNESVKLNACKSSQNESTPVDSVSMLNQSHESMKLNACKSSQNESTSVDCVSMLNQSNESVKLNAGKSTQNEPLDFRESIPQINCTTESTGATIKHLKDDLETLKENNSTIVSINSTCVSHQETDSQNKVVDLGDWEKFFNNTMNSSDASNEVCDYQDSDDDADIAASPILVSQKHSQGTRDVSNNFIDANNQNNIESTSELEYKNTKHTTNVVALEQNYYADDEIDINLTQIANEETLEIELTNDKENNCNLKESMTPLNEKITENTDNKRKEPDMTSVETAPFDVSRIENNHSTVLCNIKEFPNDSFSEIDLNSVISKQKFDGFTTASNKKIVISKEALLKAKALFIDIDSTTIEPTKEPSTILEPSGFMTASNKKITVSEEALLKAKTIFSDLDCESHLPEDNLIKHSENAGFGNEFKDDFQEPNMPTFSTASNKKIVVSDEALNKVKSIFKDIDNDVTDDTIIDNCLSDNRKPEFVGFVTASNKQITVSDEALSKVKNIFENIDNESIGKSTKDTLKPSREINSSSNVFKTTSNNNGSDENKTVCEDVDMETEFKSELGPGSNESHPIYDCNSTPGTADKFDGFKTASNKSIDVSKEALSKAKLLFDGLESEFNEDWIAEPPNKKAKITFEGSTIRKSNDFDRESLNDFTLSKPSFSGFSTASNKVISVSENSLLKAKAMFENLDDENSTLKNVTESDLKNPTMRMSSNENFVGFATASNKKIKVSEAALSKVKLLFHDIELEQNVDEFENIAPINTASVQCFSGFTTANNKNVNVSEASLKKAKMVFENIEDAVNDFPMTNTEIDRLKCVSPKQKFGGFSTASNKKITISDEALLKAKSLFVDIDSTTSGLLNEPSTISEPSGFMTANNKKITVPEDALVKAKTVFADLDCEEKLSKDVGGFMTASNKEIAVSEMALAKSKVLFEDLDGKQFENDLESAVTTFKNNQNTSGTDSDCHKKIFSNFNDLTEISVKPFMGFSTGRNKEITVSNDALQKAQNLFKDVNNENEYSFDDKANAVKKNPTDVAPSSKGHIEKTCINENLTQEISESTKALLIDEDSIYIRKETSSTSDYDDSPSSPILPSRSKKCKKVFKVPYSNDKSKRTEIKSTTKTQPVNETIDKVSDNKIDLPLKNVDLGDLYSEKLNRNETKMLLRKFKPTHNENNGDIVNLNPVNVEQFVFKNDRIDIPTNINNFSMTDVLKIFMNNSQIDRKLIPENWVINHLKWIIWKLASYERFFDTAFNGVLTVGNVLKQLKYRYDKELYKAERPLMRKILECDDVPGRKMVLCVSSVFKLVEEENNVDRYELEVTDGWYGIRASIDSLLTSAIIRGKLVEGTKIITCGAELHNCGQGKSPLEDISDVRLQLHGNSTRVAPWHAKLGACNSPGLLRVGVDSLKARAGPVPVLCFLPLVIYPQLFVEKLPTGDTITRSEKLEQIHLSSIEGDVQASLEKLYMDAENEMIGEKKTRKKRVSKGILRKELDEEDLLEMMEDAGDPGEFMASLTNTQRESIITAMDRKQVELRNKIDMRVKQLMKEKGVCNGSSRKVVSILKVRGLVLEIEKDVKKVSPVMLTVWKVQEATLDLLKSMKLLNMYWASPTGTRIGELHLSSNKQTTFCEAKNQNHLDTFPNIIKYTRKCTSILDTNHQRFTPMFNEVDTVGFVFKIEPSTMTSNNPSTFKTNQQMSPNMQTVYLSDENMNIVAVHFWGGVVKFGYEKMIEVGKVVACCNLQHRPRSSRKVFRNLYATEYTTFSQCPRRKYMEEPLRILENKLKSLNRDEYAEKCKTRLLELASVPKIHSFNSSSSSNNQSCSSFRNDSYNHLVTKRKIALDEGSLSGLDFDSSFNEPASPSVGNIRLNSTSVLNVTPDVNERIKKLKVCDEPPLLSPVAFKVSKTLRKEFVTPKIDNSINISFTSNINNNISGKINEEFDKNHDEETDSDPFKENFVYSPPDLE